MSQQSHRITGRITGQLTGRSGVSSSPDNSAYVIRSCPGGDDDDSGIDDGGKNPVRCSDVSKTATQKPGKIAFNLTLVALPDDFRPAVTRLRQLLKFALRGLRLRCVTVQELHPVAGSAAKINLEIES